MDYPFTIIEIRLDKDDKGEGKILGWHQALRRQEQEHRVENYGQQPVRFNEIHKQK